MCRAKHQRDYDQIYLNNRHESNHCQAYLDVISLSWARRKRVTRILVSVSDLSHLGKHNILSLTDHT